MALRPKHLCHAVFASALILAAPVAHAFTIEGGPDGKGGIPKFDVEEQARQFRNQGVGAAANTKSIDTPFGRSMLQFGVQQGSPFGSSFGPRLTPRDMDRMFMQPGLREYRENN